MAKEVSLSEVIKHYLSNFSDHLRTSSPATIVAYDPATQKASVQPMIHRLDSDGTLHKPAVMYGVPVICQSSGTGVLSFPLNPGDPVYLLVSDRSIDNYTYSDGIEPVDPTDRRTHDLSDAVAIAGFYPYKKALGIHPENAVFRMNAIENNAQNPGENSLHLLPTGKTDAVVINANQYNGNHSVIRILQNGDINIDTLQGTNILLNQAGDVTVNSPSKVVVNSGANTEVNASGDVDLVAEGTVTLSGSGGGALAGVVNGDCIDNLIGMPHFDRSSDVKCTKG